LKSAREVDHIRRAADRSASQFIDYFQHVAQTALMIDHKIMTPAGLLSESKPMNRSKQRGFTLIELVVVIVILGILAAFAVPKFMGLEGQARIAAVKSIGGSMEAADTMAHGIWEATANPVSPLIINGQSIAFTNTYPSKAAIGLLLDQSTSSGYANPANGEYVPNGASKNADCNATYANATTVATASGTQDVAPVVTLTTTDCN
jgi:MSHA pilin protein MshA